MLTHVPEDFPSWIRSLGLEDGDSGDRFTFTLVRADGVDVSSGSLPPNNSCLEAKNAIRNSLRSRLGRKTEMTIEIARKCLPPSNASIIASENAPLSAIPSGESASQTWAESHSRCCHKTVLDAILFEGAREGNNVSPSAMERGLFSQLRQSKLLPHLNPSGSSVSTTITPLGLNFCMSDTGRQWWLLLWTSIVSTALHFASLTPAIARDENESNGFISKIVAVLRLLASANSGRVYRVPSATSSDLMSANAIARHTINKLSLTGLCFPFKRKGEELFLVGPFFRLAASARTSRQANFFSSETLARSDGKAVPATLPIDYDPKERNFRTDVAVGSKRMREETLAFGYLCSFVGDLSAPIAQTCSDDQEKRETFSESIVTETNFRLYVYSSTNKGVGRNESPIISVVGQFADHDLTIPHRQVPQRTGCATIETFSVFRLTRPAFARAHQRGITANQIIEFLNLKSHPSLGASGVPPSIQDQLLMWQETCERVKWSPPSDPVVVLTFADEESVARVLGLGVPVGHRCGLKVCLSYADLVELASVGSL